MILFNLIFVNSNRLDKEIDYIGYNIDYTKLAYNLNIEEQEIENSDTITKQDLKEMYQLQFSDIRYVDNMDMIDKIGCYYLSTSNEVETTDTIDSLLDKTCEFINHYGLLSNTENVSLDIISSLKQ